MPVDELLLLPPFPRQFLFVLYLSLQAPCESSTETGPRPVPLRICGVFGTSFAAGRNAGRDGLEFGMAIH